MPKIIIGIHGLANKPPQNIIESWWQQSLIEGLQKNCQYQVNNLNFRLVYWADLLYKYPLHRDQYFSFDSLYNKQPYLEAKPGALRIYQEGNLQELRKIVFGGIGKLLDEAKGSFGNDLVSEIFVNKVFRDLDFYYDEQQQIKNRSGKLELARKVLRDELKRVIKEEKEQEIFLIGHSMGSIIAYDSLRDLGQTDPEIKVPYLVTIGCPLGLPTVKYKIIAERDYDARLRTPSIVTKSWVNYADKRDPVAVDNHLGDDFGANYLGIKVVDDLVWNDYESPEQPGLTNAHKSYGYLRTPELSQQVCAFLRN